MDDEALKSRDKKRDMFVRVVTLLEVMTKKDLGIDPDKILAGQEPEKTNLMLQIIGRLAPKTDSNHEKYVKAALKKLSAKDEKGDKQIEEKEPAPEPEKVKREKTKLPDKGTRSREKSLERPKSKVKEETESRKESRPVSAKNRQKTRAPIPQPTDNDEVEIESEGEEIIPDPIERPQTSRSRSRPTTAQVDPFLVQTRIADDETNDYENQSSLPNAHGALVENMLKIRDEDAVDVDQDAPVQLNAQQAKEFERKRQDLIKTQESIQQVTKAVVPLEQAAKYAQEDMQQMSTENLEWRRQVQEAQKQLVSTYKRTVVKNNSRMAATVSTLEQEVEHKKAQIRAQIYNNILLEQRLNKLTATIVG